MHINPLSDSDICAAYLPTDLLHSVCERSLDLLEFWGS